jgi:hypothetical protein
MGRPSPVSLAVEASRNDLEEMESASTRPISTLSMSPETQENSNDSGAEDVASLSHQNIQSAENFGVMKLRANIEHSSSLTGEQAPLPENENEQQPNLLQQHGRLLPSEMSLTRSSVRRSREDRRSPSPNGSDIGPQPKRISTSHVGGVKFACPFYKRDPQKFRVNDKTGGRYRACAGPGWDSVARIK